LHHCLGWQRMNIRWCILYVYIYILHMWEYIATKTIEKEAINILVFNENFRILKWTCVNVPYLVGGFKHFLFSIIYGIILPID
jgi:hypothetical protein